MPSWDAASDGERRVEPIAGDALRPTVSDKALANLATLLIGCLHARDGDLPQGFRTRD
jgi:hypothetical protein